MKKLLVCLLALVVVMGFLACGGGGGAGSGTRARAGDGSITIGFAQCKTDESDWRKANTISMLSTFAVPGYRLLLADSMNDAAKQVADVQNFIDQDVDYIVIAAVNMDGWDNVLQNAKNAGIPVILVDRNISAAQDLWTCYVGPDFKVEGEKATSWMEKHFAGKAVNIVHLQGQLGAGAQVGRTAALEDGISKNGWTLLAQQTGNWDTVEAKNVMTTWIRQYPNVNCVYAENDNMALGAIQALQEAGIRVGGDNGVAVISFDANRWALDMTLQGLINCNVECNPLHGPKVFEIVQMLHAGSQPQKIMLVPEEAFFYDTITQAIIDARQY
ncbi:MAG: ABC transporter substrate-binding protein [Treponema sp.]|jgi:simple sugar transport system substrate-binding protein|nr:ABC transporter substrate-binding protein [Treponema sp.]